MFDPAPILAGERRALARLITQVENGAPLAAEALAALYPHTGHAHRVGITGSPGAGKSSLVNMLAGAARAAGQTVAILAVDPSSPFTGGAILGDRIRMRDRSGDPGVFIRSMASRGSLGGLARATGDVVQVLDAAGFDLILVETVGAGQAEVEIARMAQTTVVVEAPGLGDDVQAIKAGLLEVADIFALNKADQPGAESAQRALRASLDLAHPTARRWSSAEQAHHGQPTPPPAEPSAAPEPLWIPPILPTISLTGQGVPELLAALARHRQHLQTSGEARRRDRERLAHQLDLRLRDALVENLLARVGPGPLDQAVERILARETDPASAARALIAAYLP